MYPNPNPVKNVINIVINHVINTKVNNREFLAQPYGIHKIRAEPRDTRE